MTNIGDQPMETAAAMEICKKRRFPQLLGKAFGFPTVSTGSTSVLLLTYNEKRRAMIHLKEPNFLS
jgi:hypothetical protein